MTTTKVAYTNWASISGVTALDSLAAGAFWGSDSVTNTTNLYVDAILGGSIDSGGTFAAGDGINIYAIAHYNDQTTTDWQAGIAGLLNMAAATDGDTVLTDATEFAKEQATFLAHVEFKAINIIYHYGGISIASAFGGVLPQEYAIVIENVSATALGASSNSIGIVGVHYTNT